MVVGCDVLSIFEELFFCQAVCGAGCGGVSCEKETVERRERAACRSSLPLKKTPTRTTKTYRERDCNLLIASWRALTALSYFAKTLSILPVATSISTGVFFVRPSSWMLCLRRR